MLGSVIHSDISNALPVFPGRQIRIYPCGHFLRFLHGFTCADIHVDKAQLEKARIGNERIGRTHFA